MTHTKEKYQLGDVDFSSIRNRNELKVLKGLARFLDTLSENKPTDAELKHIYALALNSLPARYAQKGTIVLGDAVQEKDVDSAILKAHERVLNQPKP